MSINEINQEDTSSHAVVEEGYDFKKFISHLKDPAAEPIVKYTKSFIQNFINSDKIYTMKEQIRLITDFEQFIFEKFNMYEPFKSMNSEQLKNSKDCMEKLITSKIYPRIFSPVIAKTTGPETLDEDHLLNITQDDQLMLKINEYRFITPTMLEVGKVGNLVSFHKFTDMAIKELSKLNKFKAPRDKMICILNSCKILFVYLKKESKESNADDFIPILIYTIIHSASAEVPCTIEHLASNLSYIEHFRRSDFLTGENRYYLSSLQGVVQFILDMDESNFKLEDEDEFWMQYNENKKHLKEEEEKLLHEKSLQENKPESDNIVESSYDLSLFTGLFSNSTKAKTTSATGSGELISVFSNLLGGYSGGSGPASPPAKNTPTTQPENYMEAVQETELEDHKNTLATLAEMFPEIDSEILQDICIMKKYHTANCIDTLLELSSV